MKKRPPPLKRPKPKRVWWPWAAALAGLIVVLEVYGPALSGAFVLDDRYLPFMDPNAAQMTSADLGHRLAAASVFQLLAEFPIQRNRAGRVPPDQRVPAFPRIAGDCTDRRAAAGTRRDNRPGANGPERDRGRAFPAAPAADRVGGLCREPLGSFERAALFFGVRGLPVPAHGVDHDPEGGWRSWFCSPRPSAPRSTR